MSPFDIVLGMLAVGSLFLMIRNIHGSIRLKLPVNVSEKDETIYIRGKPVRPVVYVARLPREKPDPTLGARITTIIRQSGLDATIAYTLLRADKPSLLKRIEKDIDRVKLAYEATGNPKYQEQIQTLQKLYMDIAKSTRPYTGATILIIWAAKEQLSEANALKTLIEAETGLEFKEYARGVLPALLSGEEIFGQTPIMIPTPWVEMAEENAIAVGVEVEYGSLVSLKWPDDFETHVGVIGPTGKGKTVLLQGLVMQLALLSLPDRPNILVLDPKGDLAVNVPRFVPDAELIKNLNNINRICEKPGAYVFGGLSDIEGKKLLKYILECYINNKINYRTVIVIDEAWRYIGEAVQYMESTIRQGRSLGLHIVYSTQSFDDISETIAENTGVLIVFGGTADSYINKAARLGIPAEELRFMPVGTAIVRKKGTIFRTKIFNFESYLEG